MMLIEEGKVGLCKDILEVWFGAAYKKPEEG
jgi:hypothetical protein